MIDWRDKADEMIEHYVFSGLMDNRLVNPSVPARAKLRKGIHLANKEAMAAEQLDALIDIAKPFRKEYRLELREILSYSEYRAFKNAITLWIDGGDTRRSHPAVRSLARSVADLNRSYRPIGRLYCHSPIPAEPPLFSVAQMKAIIEVHSSFMERIWYDWEKIEPLALRSSGGVHLFRGLNSNAGPDLFPDGAIGERDWLSSYSLSLAVSELFALKGKEGPVLVVCKYDELYDRVFASSLLSSWMHPRQFEFLTVPPIVELRTKIAPKIDDFTDYVVERP